MELWNPKKRTASGKKGPRAHSMHPKPNQFEYFVKMTCLFKFSVHLVLHWPCSVGLFDLSRCGNSLCLVIGRGLVSCWQKAIKSYKTKLGLL